MNSGTAKAAAILPLTAVSLLFTSISSLGAQTSSEKPNIIFILSDDLSYRDLSAYGQTAFSTPNLDRLARGVVRFTCA